MQKFSELIKKSTEDGVGKETGSAERAVQDCKI